MRKKKVTEAKKRVLLRPYLRKEGFGEKDAKNLCEETSVKRRVNSSPYFLMNSLRAFPGDRKI